MSDSTAPILFQQEGAIARIRLNRPAVLNALNQPMAQAFQAAIEQVRDSDTIRVVVLSGEGRAFMAGGDLKSFHDDLPNAGQTALDLISPLHAGLAMMAELTQPVLASLHGPVAGAGVSVALAADLAIAADDTVFNLAYAKIGASPDGSSSWTLPRVVGLRKALEIALLAENIDAAEAHRLGMVNKVVSRDTLAAQTEALAQRLASGPTQAYGRIKRLMRESLAHSLPEQLDAERDAFHAGTATADFSEGLNAFFGKRAANFTGR